MSYTLFGTIGLESHLLGVSGGLVCSLNTILLDPSDVQILRKCSYNLLKGDKLFLQTVEIAGSFSRRPLASSSSSLSPPLSSVSGIKR